MFDQSPPKCNCAIADSEETTLSSPESGSALRCCAKQRYWSMLNNKRFSDVCFVVGDEPETQEIHAHKAVLSDSSPVFETMFSKVWTAESDGVERVPDIEPAIFFSMLRFIYTDDVQLTADSVLKMLYAAKKYAIRPLESQCSEFLKEQLCPENACLLLTQARLFDQPKLTESCLKAIDENPEDAFMSCGFTNLDLPTLRSILERDTLKIFEVDLFQAVVRWSEAECLRKKLAVNATNQKSILDDAALLIRFPLMTQKDFASEVVPLQLLSKGAVIDMFQYFSDIPNTCSSFIRTPRSRKEPLIVNRFQSVSSTWACGGYYDAIGFSFDVNVKLLGFGMYIPCDKSNGQYGESHVKFEFNIILKNQETGKILYYSRAGHKKIGNDFIFQVFLNRLIRLAANTMYIICVQIEVPHCYYGTNGQTSVCVKDEERGKTATVTFRSLDYEGSTLRTSASEGQIPQILFTWSGTYSKL